jgi:hypothetical protein
MNKKDAGKLILIITVIATVIAVGTLFTAALTRPVPRPVDEEGMDEELELLSGSVWKTDSGSRKTKLKEFSYSAITGVEFGKLQENGILPLFFITSAADFSAYVRKGEQGLVLRLDGSTLDIWLSGDETILTVSGKDDYLVFVKE